MGSYTDTCRTCGKTFQNSHERRLMWCSVGCQVDANSAHLDRVVALAKALPIDEEADRRMTAMMNRRPAGYAPRKLVPAPDWSDTLALNILWGAFGCRAWQLGVHCDSWKPVDEPDRVFLWHMDCGEDSAWWPGCGRQAP